jgi:glycosyltransferase involved in cell wall biosynthesis
MLLSSGNRIPKVTVLMAVYNGERSLREALESILGQTFRDFEFLIVDDGSTDGSRDVILSYQDPRIHLMRIVRIKAVPPDRVDGRSLIGRRLAVSDSAD